LASILVLGALLSPGSRAVMFPASEAIAVETGGGGSAAHAEHAGDVEPADDDHHGGASHSDPFTFILLELGFILGIAMVGRNLANRFGQPSVLGELLIGVLVGNVGYWLGAPFFVMVMHLGSITPLFDEIWRSGHSVPEVARQLFTSAELQEGGVGDMLLDVVVGPDGPRLMDMGFALWIFSSLGVILLLFMVGLESSVAEMRQVGFRATLVALLGVFAPFLLGLGFGWWLLPDVGMPAHLFLAATLCATSVGITARVFKDLGRIQTPEAKVILGAAVIDDVLGLIILAVVVGIAQTGHVEAGNVARITGLSILFLGVVLIFGERIVRRATPFFEALDRHHGKLLFPLGLAFIMAWIANLIELAAIVGAFAAGLIINEEYFSEEASGQQKMQELIAPIEAIFAPVFFVLMGMQVNVAAFANPAVLGVALAFMVAAIAGKIVSGLGASPGSDRLSIGIGMIPRGEVGLIFASIGKAAGVVDDALFSVIVIVVIGTTLITPVALRWSLFRPGAVKNASA
jgi:Kef-type K+ transport system membrane component KefB